MREREQEDAFRAGLAELAEELGDVDATALVARARTGGARRRHRAVLATTGAAAAVLVVAGLTAVLTTRGDDSAGPAGRTPSPSVAPSAPAGYRLELWHDVGVYVPAMWGWGSAPVSHGTGSAVLCGAGVVQEDGHHVTDAALPYVGRPISLADVCDANWAQEQPQAPYVWLGGDVAPGSVDLGSGWVRDTVVVAGTTVSVASDDAALRRSILGSAHRITGACAPTLTTPPKAGGTTAADFVPVSMTVCAYAPKARHLDYDLLYEQELSMGPAKYLVAAVDSADPLGSASCYAASGGEWALLRLRGGNGTFRDYVVDMSCPSIADPTGTQHVLDGETVTPWAVGGINAVLHKHPTVDAPDRFIPPLP